PACTTPRTTPATPSPSPATDLLRRILLAAVIAGAAAGLVATALQARLLTPLVLAAQAYEDEEAPAAGRAGHGRHAHAPEWKPAEGAERLAYTVLFDVLAGLGFGLLLNAALSLRGTAAGPAIGIAYGLAGFASTALAPALGLPPELPGMPAADL